MREWIDIISETQEIEDNPGGRLDYFTITEFLTGGCAYLALAIHDVTGWPIFGEYDADGDIDHVWVINPSGQAVDIQGRHSRRLANTKYRHLGPEKIVPFSPEELRADCHDSEMMEWAEQLVKEFPEHFGIGLNDG